MTGWQALAIIAVVLVPLGALVGFVLWLADRCHARAQRTWWTMWDRVVAERRVSRDQVAAAHQWLVELAKAARPSARAEEVAQMSAVQRDVAVMLNRIQVMLGVKVDHDADTGVVSGKGLPGG